MHTKTAVAIVLLSLLSARAARAEQVVALAPNNTLILFDSATPASTTTRPITGLGANEILRGIDYRPNTGELQACAVIDGSAANSTVSVYRIDPGSGAATLIGTAGALAGAADVPTGFDFNPISTTDRTRYNNTNDENARFNPNNGALAGNDTDLTPAATTTIIAAAYQLTAPTTTTLYLIDRNDSQVSIQGGINGTPSSNGGVVTDLAPLGFNLNQTNDGGFDVSPMTGTAFAALTDAASNVTSLYTITLPTALSATPAATLVGQIGAGTEIYSMTILPPDTDGDGTRDPLDSCGTDPAKIAPGVCGCGVPDIDTDADGTLDCTDACPNDPLKTAAGACGCGVADADTNGNGVADCNDSNLPCGACGAGAPMVSLAVLAMFAARLRRRRVRRRPLGR